MLKLIPGQWPPSPDEVHNGPEYERGAGEESEAPAQGGSPGRRGETEVSQGGGGRLQGEGVQAPAEGGLGGEEHDGGREGRELHEKERTNVNGGRREDRACDRPGGLQGGGSSR